MTSLADHGYAKLPLPPYDLRHPQMAVELNAFQAAVFVDDMMEKAGMTDKNESMKRLHTNLE